MRIHFIGFEDKKMLALAGALYENGVSLSKSMEVEMTDEYLRELKKHSLLPSQKEAATDKMNKNFDAIIVASENDKNDPEVLLAKELEIPIFSLFEFLFEHAKHKTRVVIGGSSATKMLMDVILKVLEYHGKHVDYFMDQTIGEIKIKLTQKNDFIVLEDDQCHISNANHDAIHVYRPNIALLTGIIARNVEATKIFIESVVKGGILVYNEENLELKEMVEASTNTIRKHPYCRPTYKMENETIFLETPEGNMPIEFLDEPSVKHLAGAKWICQHLGVDEDDFYEAISS